MPNKFTPFLDSTVSSYTVGYFDAIFGTWLETRKQLDNWQLLNQNDLTCCDKEIDQLFWAFIAELSDQDLEECFPEFFPPSQSQESAE